jgi:hypothetical protein
MAVLSQIKACLAADNQVTLELLVAAMADSILKVKN